MFTVTPGSSNQGHGDYLAHHNPARNLCRAPVAPEARFSIVIFLQQQLTLKRTLIAVLSHKSEQRSVLRLEQMSSLVSSASSPLLESPFQANMAGLSKSFFRDFQPAQLVGAPRHDAIQLLQRNRPFDIPG